MSIGAVVVNFFTERFLADLLGDLLGSSLIGEVVVVDNGSASAPGCPDPRVRLLSPGRNIGFAAAVNLGWGALEPGHEQVLVVNPDTRMPPASLMHLHRMACRDGSPIAGPRFYWDDEGVFRLPPATGWLSWLVPGAADPDSLDGCLRSHYWAQHHDCYWSARTPFRQPWLNGACLLLDAFWLRSRGRVFDERFFMYYEDTDLCLEAMRDGIMPLCVPGAEVVHYWDQSPAGAQGKGEMMAAASRVFAAKHGLEGDDHCWAPGPRVGAQAVQIEELGHCVDAPRLPIPSPAWAEVRLEIAIEPGFVPFAQALLRAGRFVPARAPQPPSAEAASVVWLPEAIWRRLRAVRYIARLRLPTGRECGRWAWTRVECRPFS